MSRFARGCLRPFFILASMQLAGIIVFAAGFGHALAEIADATSQRPAELRHPLGPEDQQYYRQHD